MLHSSALYTLQHVTYLLPKIPAIEANPLWRLLAETLSDHRAVGSFQKTAPPVHPQMKRYPCTSLLQGSLGASSLAAVRAFRLVDAFRPQPVNHRVVAVFVPQAHAPQALQSCEDSCLTPNLKAAAEALRNSCQARALRGALDLGNLPGLEVGAKGPCFKVRSLGLKGSIRFRGLPSNTPR